MSISPALQKSVDETKVTYKQLGRSGLRVSVPILGAMSFGDTRHTQWALEEEEALPLLKAAYDRGLTTWDTANIYSNGVSEEIVGKAIKKYSLPRQKVLIFTKCFGAVGEDPSIKGVFDPKYQNTRDYVNQAGLSRQAIFNAVNASLKRLDVDYIDLLQIHRFDSNTPIEETMTALHDLVRSGKVRYIGASSMWTYQFVMMQEYAKQHGLTRFVSMQNYYNLLYREEEREMIKYCNETGVGLIPWAPLCRGILARPLDSEKTKRSSGDSSQVGHSDTDHQIVKRVQEVAEKRGWPMSHVALAWTNKRITSPIIGFSSVKRIDEACDVRGKELTEDEEKYLEELYVPRNVVGHH